jgi:hypothetical protein
MSNNAPTRRTSRSHPSTERARCEKSIGKQAATRYIQTKEKRAAGRCKALCALALTVATLPTTLAQTCIPLTDSSECRAFNSASISTNSALTGLFPFLASVTDTSSFDTQLQQYISNGFIQQRYSDLIGCSSFDSSNSSNYYARYTASVLCNAIVQNSISACGLTGDATRPLCANTCVRRFHVEARPVVADLDCRLNMPRASNPSPQATYAATQTRMLSAKFVLISQTVRYLRIRYLAHALQVLLMNRITVVSLPIWSIYALTALQVRRMPLTPAVSSPIPRIVATMSCFP